MVSPSSPNRLLSLSSLALALVALTPPARALDLSNAGSVCDQAQEVCYDGQGPSLPQTRRVYGFKAERNLLAKLSGRPPLQTFLLSNGVLCDVRARTCWDDGNVRRNISYRLTQQLYGGGGGGGGSVGNRSCLLMQRGRTLFNGSCSMTRRPTAFGTSAYVVETQDGRRYSFYNEGYGRLVLRDATGTWPVVTNSFDQRVSFRWADVELLASRPSPWGGYGYPAPRGTTSQPGTTAPSGPVTPAQALDTLLNSLFR
jgi:hypothetical protein